MSTVTTANCACCGPQSGSGSGSGSGDGGSGSGSGSDDEPVFIPCSSCFGVGTPHPTDAAPVTVDLEVEAGLQLARMVGYPHDPERDPCAFGHLTSGGTLANYQALRLALALKAFPVALRAAQVPGIALPEDDWQAFNLGPAGATALVVRWKAWLAAQTPREHRA